MFMLSCEQAGKVIKYSYSFEEEALKVEVVEEIDTRLTRLLKANAEMAGEESEQTYTNLLEQFNSLT